MIHFQRYSEPIFLLFDIENRCETNINDKDLKIFVSNKCFVDYIDGKRYVIPFKIIYNEINNSVKDKLEKIGCIPLFPSTYVTNDVRVLYVEKRKRDIRPGMNNDEKINETMEFIQKEQSLNHFENGINPTETMQEETLAKIDEIMWSHNIDTSKFEMNDSLFVIDTLNIVITKNSLARVPISLDSYDVIYPDPKTMYTTYYCSGNNIRDSELRNNVEKDVIGYYVRKNGKMFNNKQHLALMTNNDEEIIDVLE